LSSSVKSDSHVAFVALGSNLNDPAARIHSGFNALKNLAHTSLTKTSSLYRNKAIGGPSHQPDFINAVARIHTQLTPHQLLELLLQIENQEGRIRTERNAPRILDLDLLIYDNLISKEESLTIPHPRMHERRFVLQPLVEIEPDCIIPGLGKASDLLIQCKDHDLIKI
jgi:2-amino-4-hydroxy-6-hydroxymethyldihydropteridine diphosphokinase